jgi:hypothetical protein
MSGASDATGGTGIFGPAAHPLYGIWLTGHPPPTSLIEFGRVVAGSYSLERFSADSDPPQNLLRQQRILTMRRIVFALFLVAFSFSALGCHENPNAGATAPLLPKGSKPPGPALPKATPTAKSQ